MAETRNTDRMARLSALVDRIVPGTDGWPSAGDRATVLAILADAERDGDTDAVDAVLTTLPTAFASLAPADQDDAVSKLAADAPDVFARFVRHVYNVYYATPAVLAVLEAKTGYPARPPLYEGYELDAFDDALLTTQRQRRPFWRRV